MTHAKSDLPLAAAAPAPYYRLYSIAFIFSSFHSHCMVMVAVLVAYSKSYYYEPKMQLIHWRMSRNNLIKALEDNQLQGDIIVSKCNRKFIANYLFSQGITHLFC